MADLDACIVKQCEAAWDGEFIPGTRNRDNCSGFVKAVAAALGVPLPTTANADGIVDHLVADPKWSKLASGSEAARTAATGKLVLAGLKAADHSPGRNNGHVAIVIAGALYRESYPLCWGGSTGGAQSKGTKSVGEIWNRKDRDTVAYYAYASASCNA